MKFINRVSKQLVIHLIADNQSINRHSSKPEARQLSVPSWSLIQHAESEQRLYFSTHWRYGVVFTSSSEILCGVFKECLASCLQHRLHSGKMMSHPKNIHMRRHKSDKAGPDVQLKQSPLDTR